MRVSIRLLVKNSIDPRVLLWRLSNHRRPGHRDRGRRADVLLEGTCWEIREATWRGDRRLAKLRDRSRLQLANRSRLLSTKVTRDQLPDLWMRLRDSCHELLVPGPRDRRRLPKGFQGICEKLKKFFIYLEIWQITKNSIKWKLI